MSSRQLPASIRYLKAQLKILRRPSVWVSASVVLGAIVLLTETWSHPEKFTAPNTASDSGLSSPNAAAPVRPDPALLDPLSTVEEAPSGAVTERQTPLSARSSSAANQQTSPLPAASDRLSAPLAPDPFTSIRTGDRSATNRNSSGTGSLSNSGLSSGVQNPDADPPSGDAADSNPLQSALDRHAAPTPAQPSPQISVSNSPANSAETSPELQTPAAPLSGQSSFVQPQPLPGQPSSYGQTQPQPQFVPQTSPAPGTTGYTMPPAFRTNANTSAGRSFGPYRNNPSAAPTTGFSSSQPSPAVQPQPQPSPAPFSVPRAIPGQPIGGGEINTFSNP